MHLYLSLAQLADSFGVRRSLVESWVEKEGLPCIPDRGRLLFDRGEVTAWAAKRGLISRAGFLTPERHPPRSTRRIEAMLRAGGIQREVPPERVLDAIEGAAAKLPGATPAVVELLVRRVRMEDGISWAPVGGGLALPHLHTPVTLGRDAGILSLLFLTEPLSIAGTGPDGQPVTGLLFFIAPSPRAHLELLGQLSSLFIRGSLRRLVLERAPDDEIFAALADVDAADEASPPDRTAPGKPEGGG
ncbi:MAG: PTS sugar transporter subunit IIA [Acidobacteria bacterium]|nr:PTS sugar transporter subunit IIA [Acidobacteriota bacterium]